MSPKIVKQTELMNYSRMHKSSLVKGITSHVLLQHSNGERASLANLN